jgi:hypothetical protein
MIVQQIRALGARLSKYLAEFAGCFKTPETRQHLTEYVQGQISNLPRKRNAEDQLWEVKRKIEDFIGRPSFSSGTQLFSRPRQAAGVPAARAYSRAGRS